jgi:predicted negative regulator of RcsB-dependent stress response
MWPEEYSIRIASRQPGTDDPYAGDREILDLAHVFDVADEISASEHVRAQEIAAVDGRIRAAMGTSGAGLIQVLAAGPELVRWWEQAPNSYAKALITAAVDARRLGVLTPVTSKFLADAAPGYLSPAQRATAPHDWLQHALNYCVTPLHGAASVLIPVDDGVMGRVAGYTAADYLLQHGQRSRRSARMPALVWQALIKHTVNQHDIWRLANSAERRALYCYAEPLYHGLAAAGDSKAVGRLAHQLGNRGLVDEAIEFLRAHDESGSTWMDADALIEKLDELGRVDEAVELLQFYIDTRNGNLPDVFGAKLAEMLAKHDRVDELRARADAGDWTAIEPLAELLARQGQVDELSSRADTGGVMGVLALGEQYLEQGRLDDAIDILRPNANTLPSNYVNWVAISLAEALVQRGDLDEAADVLRSSDSLFSALSLAEVLDAGGHVNEALEVLRVYADEGIGAASDSIAKLLARSRRIEELRARADLGDASAAHRLAEFLVEQENLDEAIKILRVAENSIFAAKELLVELLARQGHFEELRSRTDAGDGFAAHQMAAWLAKRGEVDELRAELDAGNSAAADQLVDLLINLGAQDQAEHLRKHGIEPDGQIG